MRLRYIFAILVLLALAVPPSPARAGGVVTVCDEAHLRAALAGGGTVMFTCSGVITLADEIVIAANVTIDGSGQDVTISGNHAVRVFRVDQGWTLNLRGLAIVDGVAPLGGAIYVNTGVVNVSDCTFSDNHADTGAGIYSTNYATLTVTNGTFSGNSANSGGGIASDGMVTVRSSTFSANSAISGGGILNGNTGTMTVSNSTFASNSASWQGGGLRNGNYATLDVSNSTFSGNSATNGGGLYNDFNNLLTLGNSTFSGNSATVGSGILNHYDGTLILKNTIVANSPTGNNCSGTVTDGGGNLSFPDATCPGTNADPLLGPLQDNGGPTKTMALGEGSAAIDTADDAICAAPPVNNLDQRGFPRPWGAHCDIGAVEQIQEPSAVSVSALRAQSPPGTITPAMIAGLLLLVLVAVGVQRRPRHIG